MMDIIQKNSQPADSQEVSLREKINEYAPLPLVSLFTFLVSDGNFKASMGEPSVLQIGVAGICAGVTFGRHLRCAKSISSGLTAGVIAGSAGLFLAATLNVPKTYDYVKNKDSLKATKLAQTPKLDPETMIRAGDAFCNAANPNGQPSFINLGPTEFVIDCSKYAPEQK